jgi:hypothetical protein
MRKIIHDPDIGLTQLRAIKASLPHSSPMHYKRQESDRAISVGPLFTRILSLAHKLRRLGGISLTSPLRPTVTTLALGPRRKSMILKVFRDFDRRHLQAGRVMDKTLLD